MKLTETMALTKQKRLQKLHREYIEGDYTNRELAARHGVTDALIAQDLTTVRAMIAMGFDEEEMQGDLQKRLKQLEATVAECFEGFKRSRRDHEEVSTRYDKRGCRNCKGKGETDGGTCERCEGLGYRIEEVMSRKVSGQAGDPRFLALIQSGVREICRIKGHYPEKTKRVVKEIVTTEKRFEGVDPELIVRHRMLLIQIEQSKNGRDDDRGEVLDVESEETEKEKRDEG